MRQPLPRIPCPQGISGCLVLHYREPDRFEGIAEANKSNMSGYGVPDLGGHFSGEMLREYNADVEKMNKFLGVKNLEQGKPSGPQPGDYRACRCRR